MFMIQVLDFLLSTQEFLKCGYQKIKRRETTINQSISVSLVIIMEEFKTIQSKILR